MLLDGVVRWSEPEASWWVLLFWRAVELSPGKNEGEPCSMRLQCKVTIQTLTFTPGKSLGLIENDQSAANDSTLCSFNDLRKHSREDLRH